MAFWPFWASIVRTCLTVPAFGVLSSRSSPSDKVSLTACGAAGPLMSEGSSVNFASFKKTPETGFLFTLSFAATALMAGRPPAVPHTWSPTGPAMYLTRPHPCFGYLVVLLIANPAQQIVLTCFAFGPVGNGATPQLNFKVLGYPVVPSDGHMPVTFIAALPDANRSPTPSDLAAAGVGEILYFRNRSTHHWMALTVAALSIYPTVLVPLLLSR